MGLRPVSLTKKSPPRTDQAGETTRRLCAGVYLDHEFRDTVLRDVLHDPYHRVAPSYGFDLVPVAAHAWRAWCLETIQHTGVLTILLAASVQSPPAAITAVCLLVLWGLAAPTLRLLPEVAALGLRVVFLTMRRRYLSLNEMADANRFTAAKQWLKLYLGGCALALIVPVVCAGRSETPFSLLLLWATATLGLMAGLTAITTAARHRAVGLTRVGDLRPPELNGRLRTIDRQQDETVVVNLRPEPMNPEDEEFPRLGQKDRPSFFVGSGKLVHRWLPPLTIQLLRPAEDRANGATDDLARREYTTPPFEAYQLVDHLRHRMRPLGHTADPVRLPGYRIRHRVYVAEQDVRSGAGAWDAADLREIINDPHGAAQHFLEIRVTSNGELVTTVFLRATVKGRCLTLDLATCALTRTPTGYQHLGRLAHPSARAVTCSVLLALFRLPAELSRCRRLPAAAMIAVRAVRTFRSRRLEAGAAPRISVREEKAADWDLATFDEPTILAQMKIIEQRLLKATRDFLKSCNVDTSTFEKRAETIISASVLNMGGRVDISNSAVGDNARVDQNAPIAHAAMEGAAS